MRLADFAKTQSREGRREEMVCFSLLRVPFAPWWLRELRGMHQRREFDGHGTLIGSIE
jgi:hypothetical protein